MLQAPYLKTICCLSLIWAVLVASCSQPNFITSTVNIATSVNVTSVPPSETPSLIATPIGEKQSPTSLLTATASPAPTIAPLSTLNAMDAEQEIVRLMQTNDQCLGACFWGITPNVTHLNDAARFLKTLKNNALVETKDHYMAGYQYKGNKITVSLEISASGGIVQNLSVTIDGIGHPDVTGKDWLAFKLDSFLKAHGIPKRVNIIMSQGPEGRIGYELLVFYDQMYVRISGNQTVTKPQGILHTCPNQDHNLQRVQLQLGQYDEELLNTGVKLSRITPLTQSTFYQLMTKPPDQACLSLDLDKYLSSK